MINFKVSSKSIVKNKKVRTKSAKNDKAVPRRQKKERTEAQDVFNPGSQQKNRATAWPPYFVIKQLIKLDFNNISDKYRTVCDDAYQVGTLLITVHVDISG